MQSPLTIRVMAALGETFRTARESQGLSLAEVADRIHIRSMYLAAIESEDWQVIGPSVYVKGFIRSYARSLGLDPDEAVARFNGEAPAAAARPTVIRTSSGRSESLRSGRSHEKPAKTGPSVWAVLAAIVAIGLVMFVGYEYLSYRHAGSAAHRGVVALPVESPPASPQASPDREAAARTAPELHAAEPNTTRSSGLGVRLKDGSWLRVVVDGKVVMDGLYPAGTARSYAGHLATVRVGNAGGVEVTVNGKNLGALGGVGDVAERSFQL